MLHISKLKFVNSNPDTSWLSNSHYGKFPELIHNILWQCGYTVPIKGFFLTDLPGSNSLASIFQSSPDPNCCRKKKSLWLQFLKNNTERKDLYSFKYIFQHKILIFVSVSANNFILLKFYYWVIVLTVYGNIFCQQCTW